MWKGLELSFWSTGITLMLVFLGAQALGEIERQRGIEAFDALQKSPGVQRQTGEFTSPANTDAEASRPTVLNLPTADGILAVLRIPDVGLELPVRYGTSKQVLRRGPGLVEGTSRPGSDGNVAIAAHRDAHFRPLKDLELGDAIELSTAERTQTYIVTQLSVVEPADVHVLEEVGKPVLTLVTCFPFHFVGSAPQRYIVRAETAELLQ